MFEVRCLVSCCWTAKAWPPPQFAATIAICGWPDDQQPPSLQRQRQPRILTRAGCLIEITGPNSRRQCGAEPGVPMNTSQEGCGESRRAPEVR